RRPFGFDWLDGAARGFDLLAGASRKLVRAHGELDGQLAFAQDFDRAALAAQDAHGLELLGPDRAALGKAGQVAHVDFAGFDAEGVDEAAAVRQLANERQLAALEVGWDTAAGTGVLAFGALPASLDLAAAVAASDADAVARSAAGRTEL